MIQLTMEERRRMILDYVGGNVRYWAKKFDDLLTRYRDLYEMTAGDKGRPVKLNEALPDLLYSMWCCGWELEDAVKYLGISWRSLQRWISRGKKDEKGMYWDLYVVVDTTRMGDREMFETYFRPRRRRAWKPHFEEEKPVKDADDPKPVETAPSLPLDGLPDPMDWGIPILWDGKEVSEDIQRRYQQFIERGGRFEDD